MMSRLSTLLLILMLTFQASLAQDWLSMYQTAQQEYSNDNLELALASAKNCLKTYQSQDGSFNGNYESILRLLTNLSSSTGNYEEGLEYCIKELAVKEQTGNLENLEHATALYNRGSLELNLSQYENALKSFSLAHSIYEQFYSADELVIIECQWKIAETNYQVGNSAIAMQIYDSSIPNADLSEGVTMEYLQAAFYYSNLLMDGNKHQEAYGYLVDLKDYYEQLGAEYELALINMNTGLCLHKVGNYQDAELSYLASDNNFKNVGEDTGSDYFNMINLRAVNFEKLGNSDKAAELLKLVGTQGDVNSKSIALSNEALMEYQSGDFEAAEKSFEALLAIEGSSTNAVAYSNILLDLALVKLELNKASEAESILQKAPPIIETVANNLELKAKEHYVNGKYKDAIGDWQNALISYKAALNIITEMGSADLLAVNVLGALGVNYQANGDFIEAESAFKKQQSILDAKGQTETSSYAITLNNLGTVKQSQAEFLQAQNYLESAREITEAQLGTESLQYAGIVENLGLTLIELGNYSAAENYINQSIEIRKATVGSSDPLYANAIQNLGRIKQRKGKYQEAEPLFAEALQLKKQAFGSNNPEYANALNSSALLYQTMGNFDQAKPLFEEAVGIFKATYGEDHPEYATSLENLATLYKLQGNNSESLALLEQALVIDRKVYGENHPRYATTLHNLASIYKDIDEVEKARTFYLQALEIDKNVFGTKHPTYATTAYNLGTLNQQLGLYDQAELNFKEALSIRKEVLGENHPDYAYALYGLAGLYHGTQKLAEAKPYYDEVIVNYLQQITDFFPSLSENEKGAFYAKIKPVISSYQDYCIEYAYSDNADAKNAIGDLYNLQLRTKALLLHSSNKVRNRIFASGDQKLIDEYLAWTELKEQLSKYLSFSEEELNAQGIVISEVSQKINSIEKNLSQKSEVFGDDVDQKSYKWEDIKDVLVEGEAALEIIRVNKRFVKDSVLYVALIVKPSTENAPEMVILNDGNNLESRYFNNYRNSIKFTFNDEYSFKEYWQPINTHFDNINQVYASTDGIFNKININTLWDTEEKKYVIDEYIVRNISNTKEILFKGSTASSNNSAEVFGFPDFDLIAKDQIIEGQTKTRASEFGFTDIIPELPGTRDEVNKINELLETQAWQANLYLRASANETNLKAINPPKLLHVATHGFFKSDVVFEDDKEYNSGYSNAEQNPLFRSGLLFAGSANNNTLSNNYDEEDGVLTAYEAMNLNLDNTELVVLSACETGIGEVKNGEGVYGLQRSFMVAGAKAVIMSLWQVDDNTTQQLMVHFYENWLTGTDKFESFKNAQLELKEKYADPFHWGAFIIIGTD